jgi:hypothetical protein
MLLGFFYILLKFSEILYTLSKFCIRFPYEMSSL